MTRHTSENGSLTLCQIKLNQVFFVNRDVAVDSTFVHTKHQETDH